MSPEKFQESLETLKTKANEWRCEDLEGLKLAIGFAFARDYENCTAGELIKEADFAMYDAKAAYYAQTGKERRKRRTERRGRHEAIL
jgi:GGDEF domain-containing protein